MLVIQGHHMLGCVSQNVASRQKKINIPSYLAFIKITCGVLGLVWGPSVENIY